MKSGWQTRTLSEVSIIKPPKAEAKAKLNGDDEVSFAPMEELGIGCKFLSPNSTRTLREVSGSYTYFADGDVLLAKITPCFENGKLGIARGLRNGVGFGSSEYIVFRPSSALSSEFLYYYLDRPQFRIEGAQSMSGVVGHKRVSKEFIESYKIPVPPIEEQHRIVAILDEAFTEITTAKANAEKNLQNARALFESYLNKVFTEQGEGWLTVPFGEIAAFRNGINFTKSSKGTPIKILGVKDFQNNYWAPFEDFESIIPEGIVPDSDTVIEGDIVFVRSNGNPDLIGRCLLIGKLPERATHSGFTIKARLQSNTVMPAYLCHFLKSKGTRQEMIDGGNGANIKSLNQGTLARIVVPFPSLDKQAEVVQQLEIMQAETQRLESIYKQKLTALDELKQSLLHQAFSGAL